MKKEKQLKLVLWDLDGTLINTIEDLGAAVNHALQKRSLPLHGLDEYTRMVGHGVRNLVAQALPAALQADETLIDSVLADFRAYYCAHMLQARGIKMAVASNKFQEGTEQLVGKFFPDIDFVAVLGNRPGYPLKPSPEIVQDVLSRAGLAPEEAIMVGDSPTDMQTAANGGIEAIAVTWGYRSAAQLSGNRTVNSLEELQEALECSLSPLGEQ